MTTSAVKSKIIKREGEGFGLILVLEDGGEREIRDLTYDHGRIVALSDAINRLDVSHLHIDDIIDDFLG